MNNLIYGIKDVPKTAKEWILYSLQQTLSILTATVLIATITGTNVAAGLVAAGAATMIFLLFTKFKAPLFFSLSGSTCAAVITAIQLSGDLTGVFIGGLFICLMNCVAALLIKQFGSSWINKILPPMLSGTIVLIIGANLSFFSPTYALVNGSYSLVGVIVALITMVATVCIMRYAKGLWTTLPFLGGVAIGYIVSIIITLLGIAPLVNFEVFKEMSLFISPEFAWRSINFADFNWANLPTLLLVFGSLNLANLAEHVADIKAASAVVGEDLTKTVGLHKTIAGDGIADAVGCFIGGNPTTTYSESLGTITVSRVASTRVIALAAIFAMALGFIGPFNTLIVSMPNCVFSGVSLVAYGMIAASGLKVIHGLRELSEKDIIIFAVMLTVGISGLSITFGHFTLETIALSMIVGLILNLIL